MPRRGVESITTPPGLHRSPPARAGGTAGRLGGVHLARASGRARAISPDARCGHPCPPLARGKPSSAILAALGFPTPARLARAHPSRTRIPFVSIEAPRREPGGRRAVGRNRSPGVRKPFTTNTPDPLSPPPGSGASPWGRAWSLPILQVANLQPRWESPVQPRWEFANPYSVRPRVGKGYRHLASLGASPLFH